MKRREYRWAEGQIDRLPAINRKTARALALDVPKLLALADEVIE